MHSKCQTEEEEKNTRVGGDNRAAGHRSTAAAVGGLDFRHEPAANN